MNIDITQIIVAVIGLISLIITSVVVPWIKSKTSASQWQTIEQWVSTAVEAAEVIYEGAGRGEEKREYVLNMVQELCNKNGIKFDSDVVRMALENAWKTMTTNEKILVAQIESSSTQE